MSNPAVVKLVSGRIGNSNFWSDDNFGEAIHLHLDNYRVDLNIKEFDVLTEQLKFVINNMVEIDEFNCEDFDPTYLSLFLSKKVLDLKEMKMDTIRLSELLVYKKVFYRFSILTKLKNGKVYKALCGNPKENNEIRESHHVFQNSQQRLDEIYNSLQNTKYPSENKYIILYGDSNLIWDGQHRASCLLYMYGDIEVPVKRLYFFDTKKSKKEYFKFFIKKMYHLRKFID